MKKTKAIIFIAASAILLMGCSRGGGGAVNDGKLPSGGEKTDLATSEGQELMKNRMDAVSKAYEGLDLESVSITSETSGVNVALDANVEMKDVGKISLEAGLKGFGMKEELKAAKDGKNAKASISAKTTGGNVSVKASLPGKEQGKTANLDASLSLSGIEANAYLADNNFYADMSNKGNETFVKNAETFVNTLIDQFKETAFGSYLPYLISNYDVDDLGDIYDVKTNHFNFVTAYNKYLPEKKIAIKGNTPFEWPTISTDEIEEETSIELDDIGEYMKQLAEMKINIEIVTYKDGAFGFSAALDKESLKAVAKMTGSDSNETWYNSLPDMFSNLECNVSAYFNKDNLLESVGFAYDCEAKMDKALLKTMGADVEGLTAFDVKYSLKAKETVSIKYGNVEVKLPDFSDYKEIKMDNTPTYR